MTDLYIIKAAPTGSRRKDTEVLRAGLYALLEEKLALHGWTGEITKAPGKKPCAEGFAGDFNISHTSGCGVLAISDSPVGVDVERIRPVNLKIAEKFCADEREFIEKSEDCRRAFFEIWTAKEAYLKKEGTGITVPLNSFSVLGLSDIRHFYFDDFVVSVCGSGEIRINKNPAES